MPRFLEAVLHVSYRLEIKSWCATKGVKRESMERMESKKAIQDEFRARTGLLVDRVKQGAGSTNDGNTARRFFENVKLTSEITDSRFYASFFGPYLIITN